MPDLNLIKQGEQGVGDRRGRFSRDRAARCVCYIIPQICGPVHGRRTSSSEEVGDPIEQVTSIFVGGPGLRPFGCG
jgi:hypothetical protein